jgi:hypothetical protein
VSYSGFVEAGVGEDDDEDQAHLQMLLSSIDDLAVHANEGSRRVAAFQPGTAWKPYPRSIAVAADAGSLQGASQHLTSLQQQLPAGVQAVLQQAASLGVSPKVIRRTMARLSCLFQN